MDGAPSAPADIPFVVKRPALTNRKDLQMKLSSDATLMDVKAQLSKVYDDHPPPATITVIFAGKVLKDDSMQLKDVFASVTDIGILPALHVVVRAFGADPPPAAATAAAAQPFSFTAAPRNAQRQTQPQLHRQQTDPPPRATASAAEAPPAPAQANQDAGQSTLRLGSRRTPEVHTAMAAAVRRSVAAAASAGEAASAADKGKAPAASAAAAPSEPVPQPLSPSVSPTLPNQQSASSSLPQPELPPQLVNNPAMAAAFSAAFAALTSPTAIHNLGVPQRGFLQPQMPFQGQGTPQQALLDALMSGQPLQQQHPFPHLQPIFPQPISYMPVLGLVQPPPSENGQQQQPHYAPVLAPVVPMMMPYGMMPYSAGPLHFAAQPQPQPMPPGQHPQQQQQQQAQPRMNVQNLFQGVPGIGMWPQQAGAAAAAAARPARGARERRPRQVRVRMVQINLRAILQLAVMGIILYQHCPPGRFLLFATVGLALYVMGPAPLRRAWQRLLAMLPPMHGPGQQDAGMGGAAAAGPAPADGGAPAAAAGAGARPVAPAAAAAAGQTGQARPRGFVQEMQALVVGFFTSLLPGFNINPEDAAAFAAAQQVANRNEAMAAAREHRD